MNSNSGSGDRALSKFFSCFDPIRLVILFFAFLCIFALVFSYDYQNRSDFSIGDTAPRDLYAKRSVVPYYNRVKTDKLREEAAADVEIRLTQNTAIADETIDQINYLYQQILDERNNRLKKDSEKIDEISDLLGLSDDEITIAEYLLTTEPDTITQIFEAATTIDLDLLEMGVRKENLLRKYETIDLVALANDINERPETSEAIAFIAKKELRPNLSVDEEATRIEKEKARERIIPIQENIRMNEKLVEKGDILTTEDIERLRAAGYLETTGNWIIWVHSLVYPFLLLLFLFLYAIFSDKREWIVSLHKYVLLLASVVGMIALTRFVIPVSDSMVPLFMFSILLTIFYTKPFGYYLTTILVLLFFPFFGMDFVICTVYLFSVFIAIQLFSTFRSYANYIQKCFTIALFFGVLSLVLISISPGYFLTTNVYLYALIMFLNGVVSGLFTLGIILLLERVFLFVTPLRLIELSDSNSPLLRHLFEVAPGSYQHSIMVANIASHAAERINANDMLVRVGAYYHDIGKSVFPFYFTENSSGKNILDDKNPTESVDIIKGHVTNGEKLAEKIRLPNEIQRFITTHHGTTRISFLFQAAQKVNPDLTDDSEFRYPGPKPISKEETILMLSDSIEAAIRSLPDKSTDSIRSKIESIIDSKIKDGQLNESLLSFQELQQVKESFVFTLDSLYHSRISYPVSQGFEKKSKPPKKTKKKNYFSKRGRV